MEDIPKNLVWLASYPKSGNTWFRLFLNALFNNGKLDINNLSTADLIFSSKSFFEEISDLPADLLLEEEIKRYQPLVFTDFAMTQQKDVFVKVHDAFQYSKDGQPIIPAAVTKCALCFIRNPLDLAASLANHYALSMDEAVKMLNNPLCKLAKQHDKKYRRNQFQQDLFSWSTHVQSWLDVREFPVLFLRYEDMVTDTFSVFKKALQFLQYTSFTDEEISKAIEVTGFKRLQEAERTDGFREKLNNNYSFFRKGKTGGWKEELTEEQIQKIIGVHHRLMQLFGYPANA